MSLGDRFDTWYHAQPAWIRIPLAAAAVTFAIGLFQTFDALLNTLQQPVPSPAARFRSAFWLALAGICGGLVYALVSPRLSPRGRSWRLATGILTMFGALLPTFVLLIGRGDWRSLVSLWFWLPALALALLGGLVIGRPWRGAQSRTPPRLRATRDHPPSARDYNL